MSPPSSSSCILYENASRTIVVVDVPRSIEEAQDFDVDDDRHGRPSSSRLSRRRRRLFSTAPPVGPFPAPPNLRAGDTEVSSADMAAQLAELTTTAAATSALDELHGRTGGFHGPWCLPRCYAPTSPALSAPPSPSTSTTPPGAHYLATTIAAGRDRFLAEAPIFDLVVLDPPWPNRSARRRWRGRKRRRAAEEEREGGGGQETVDTGYATASDMAAVRALLEQIPVGAKLAENSSALVAVWVTNKPACTALLTDPKHGLFRAWGVEHVATWTWLKVTTAGKPVVPVNAPWRKPWERLLLARRGGRRTDFTDDRLLPPDRVLVAVPDVHSRKPNLRPLLAPFLTTSRPIVGLEVFARNLTAGWWAWGDEALLFQQASWWTTDELEGEVEINNARPELVQTIDH